MGLAAGADAAAGLATRVGGRQAGQARRGLRQDQATAGKAAAARRRARGERGADEQRCTTRAKRWRQGPERAERGSREAKRSTDRSQGGCATAYTTSRRGKGTRPASTGRPDRQARRRSGRSASNNLRNQERLSLTANRCVHGRNCLEIGGVWIDDAYKADTKSVAVKAQSDAYFRILEKHPKMKDVFRLGNHVVWITPSGTALVIDQNDGKEKLDDAEIEALFAKKSTGRRRA